MLRKFRAALLAAGAVAALAGPAAAETLAEAVALAYQTNPTLRAQRAQLRALDEGVIQARAGYAPRADLEGGAGYTENFEQNQGSGSLNARLGVSQPLYTGGRVAASVDNARADVLAGREQLRSVEASVLVNVIQAYADVRRFQEELRIRTENVAVLRRQLDETGARFEVGEITRTDVAQAESRLALSQANLAVSQANLANARANYARVVGQNPGELAPEPALPVLPATVDEAFVTAELENPSIRAADFATRSARARVRAARAQSAPSLSLGGSLSAFQAPVGLDIDDVRQEQAQVSVNATVPLFTGGLNASRVRQALEDENRARFRVDETRREVLNNVAQAWNGLIAARAGLLANQEQVAAARVAFEGAQAEAQVGLRTTLDVLNAQQELRNAELLLVNARRDAYVSEAQVLAAMGRLEAVNLIGDVPFYDPAYTVRRRGLRDGVLPYEPLIERLDRVGAPVLERANRTAVPVVEAPLDPTAEWRPRSAPAVIPQPPPPPVTPLPASPPTVSDVRPPAR